MADWNVALYEQKHAFVTAYGQDVLALLNAQSGERVLDLGCGTGHHVKALADLGVQAVGLDSSPSMITAAQQAYPELSFMLADASNFQVEQPFDAIVSSAALHWVMAPDDAARCMSQALKPDGRLVIEMGGKGNIAQIEAGMQVVRQRFGVPPAAPRWYFPSIGEYTSVLERHGLEVQYAYLFDRPTQLNDGEQGLRNWITMFGHHLLADVPETRLDELWSAIEHHLRPALFTAGSWYADYRRLRVVAIKRLF